MNTENRKKINQLLRKIPSGTVVTAEKLESLGVSYGLARNYVKSGWLSRVSNGAYTRLDESADLNGALYALQNNAEIPVHLGGITAATNLYNRVHFLRNDSKSHLFAPSGTKIPLWFTKTFGLKCELHRTDFLPANLGMVENNFGTFALKVPTLERALLELCYLVPAETTSQEAFSIMETALVLKPRLLQQLLESCSSVKVKRMFLCFAEQAGVQWLNMLDLSKIDLGKGKRTIEAGGKLFPKYNLVMNLER